MRGPSGDGGKSATTMAAQVRRQGWTGTADLPEDIVVPLRCSRDRKRSSEPASVERVLTLRLVHGVAAKIYLCRMAVVRAWHSGLCVLCPFSDGYRAHANCRCSLISQFQGERRHMTHVHCSSNLLRNYADDMYSQLARDRS